MNGFISSQKQTNLKISKLKAVTNTNVIFLKFDLHSQPPNGNI